MCGSVILDRDQISSALFFIDGLNPSAPPTKILTCCWLSIHVCNSIESSRLFIDFPFSSRAITRELFVIDVVIFSSSIFFNCSEFIFLLRVAGAISIKLKLIFLGSLFEY